MEEQTIKKNSRAKAILRAIDLVSLIPGIVFAIIYVFLCFTNANRLYTPPDSPLVKSPHPDKETLPTWSALVIIIAADLIPAIFFFFLSKPFPNVFRKFNIFTLVWTGVLVLTANGVCTNIFKSYVGRPRPDTEAVCGSENMNDCLNARDSKREDQFKSWPSGHSSSAMSGLLFGALFVQNAFEVRGLWVSIASSLYVILAVFIGATRIRNYRHNPDDVACGFLIGAIYAFIIWDNAKKRIFTPIKWSNEEEADESNVNL